MTEKENELGALQTVYKISPAYLQRAAIVAALSFMFFIAMLIAYSQTQKFGFFIIGTAFLVVEILTLLGWQSLRRNELRVFENGFMFRQENYLWNEIKSINVNRAKPKITGEVETKNNKKIVFTDSIHDVENFFKKVESKLQAGK